MQTFLPHPSFAQSAACLDNRRLGKQRVETLQILNALTVPSKGWKNHPATKMWSQSIPLLVCYGLAMCEEWRHKRGFQDTCADKIARFFDLYTFDECRAAPRPAWLGDPDFHRSHQSNLVRKMPSHYRQYFPDVPDDLPYIWPSAL